MSKIARLVVLCWLAGGAAAYAGTAVGSRDHHGSLSVAVLGGLFLAIVSAFASTRSRSGRP